MVTSSVWVADYGFLSDAFPAGAVVFTDGAAVLLGAAPAACFSFKCGNPALASASACSSEIVLKSTVLLPNFFERIFLPAGISVKFAALPIK